MAIRAGSLAYGGASCQSAFRASHDGGGQVEGFFASSATSRSKGNVNKRFACDIEILERRVKDEDAQRHEPTIYHQALDKRSVLHII